MSVFRQQEMQADLCIAALESAFAKMSQGPAVGLMVGPELTTRAFECLREMGMHTFLIVTVPHFPRYAWAVYSPTEFAYNPGA